MKRKVVPKLRQEVKVKVDIVTCDNIKIYYTGKFQDFTAKYIIKLITCIYVTFDFTSVNVFKSVFIMISRLYSG